MASSTSPFTYEAVDVIFGSIYFHFHIQTAPNLQDCPYSDNLPTFPDFTLLLNVKVKNNVINLISAGSLPVKSKETIITLNLMAIQYFIIYLYYSNLQF